jgi:hypothetical protein
MADFVDHARIENLDYDGMMKRAFDTEPDSFLDAFAALNVEWMQDQLRLAREYGDDPRDLAFILEGALHESLEGFEIDNRSVIRREHLERISREQGGALLKIAEVVAREHLPGFVPVVITVGARTGIRSLDLYTPKALGAA